MRPLFQITAILAFLQAFTAPPALAGKISGTNVGFLNMQTGDALEQRAADNFTVGRLSRELPNRSRVGAIFINRIATGSRAPPGDFNRTYGVDGRWGMGSYTTISGFLAATSSPDRENDQYAYQLEALYDSPRWRLNLDYVELGRNFSPEVGFIAREGGYRKPEFEIRHRYRPANLAGLLELRPHVNWRGFWTPDGFQQTGKWHFDNHWVWRNGYEMHTGVNLTREGVQESFEIFPGIPVLPGTYDHTEAVFDLFSDAGRPFSFDLSGRAGGFFGGDRLQLEPTVRWRTSETFSTELGWSRNDIDLPSGSFTTNLGRLRISYSFNPRMLIQTLVQYNDRSDVWSTNFRFSWLQTANTGLFLVYNTSHDLGNGGPELPDRRLIVKVSRLFE